MDSLKSRRLLRVDASQPLLAEQGQLKIVYVAPLPSARPFDEIHERQSSKHGEESTLWGSAGLTADEMRSNSAQFPAAFPPTDWCAMLPQLANAALIVTSCLFENSVNERPCAEIRDVHGWMHVLAVADATV